MTINLDSFSGGDSHKVWDIHNLDGLPVDKWAVQVIQTLRNKDETWPQTAQRVLGLPSAQKGMPTGLKRQLMRVAAGMPPRSAAQGGPKKGQSQS